MTEKWPTPTAAHVPPPQFGTPSFPAVPAATPAFTAAPAHLAEPQPGRLWLPSGTPTEVPLANSGQWAARTVIILVGVAVMVAGGLLQASDRGQQQPQPTTPPAISSVQPRTPAETRLMANAMYPLTISGACPEQTSATSRSDYQVQVGALLDCLAGLYQPLITRAGFEFRYVNQVYYDSKAETPCGAETDAYAFYCEANSTIYLSEDVYRNAEDQRLSVADVVIHEYSHHVQSMSRIFDSADEWYDANAVERRQELQALCLTYYTFMNVSGFDVDSDDKRWFYYVMANTDDPVGHGSVKAQQLWGMRGMTGTSFGSCNTWAVPASEVD